MKDTCFQDEPLFSISRPLGTSTILEHFPNIISAGNASGAHLDDELIQYINNLSKTPSTSPNIKNPDAPPPHKKMRKEEKKKKVVTFKEEECSSSEEDDDDDDEDSETESKLINWSIREDISSMRYTLDKVNGKLDSTMKTIIPLITIIKQMPKYMLERKDLQSGEELINTDDVPKEDISQEINQFKIKTNPVIEGNHTALCCCETCWADPNNRRSFF